jgi:coenzyme F420-reducing hydrogenase delta subunit
MYPTAETRLAHRLASVKAVLDETGLGRERLDHWVTHGSAEVSWAAFWEISRRKLRQLLAEEKAG